MGNKRIIYFKSIPKHIWILALIIVAGIFFRTYNFHDWLQFNQDAMRDATLVSHSVLEGAGSLPLLGPRAGGTTLHLGPVFYYFQYISGAIFHSTSPVVFAFPNLLFSILAIPLFFLLLRRYFSPILSTMLTGMLAFSFMATEYGRFAWNPNSTPFFIILFSYSLLKAYENGNKKLIWLAISGSALAIASQLHFTVFLGFPIIFILFVGLNWHKSKEIFSWKALLVFFGTIFIFYIPFITFDVLTYGKNFKEFLGAIQDKGFSGSLLEKIVQNANMFFKYFLWISAGITEGKWWQEIITGIFYFLSFIANLFLLFTEKNENKKIFLLFTSLFILVYFVLYIPLAFEIDRSRFFLPLIIIPFVFIGYAIVSIKKIGFSRSAFFGGTFLIAFLVFYNAKSTLAWFSDMSESQNKKEMSQETLTKDKGFWWTWGRFEKAAEYMQKNCDKNALFFLTSQKTMGYNDSFKYAFTQNNKNLIIEAKSKYKEKYENDDRCYFYISLAKETLPDFILQKKHDESFFIGDMQIAKWYPENALQPVYPDNSIEEEKSLEKKIDSKFPRLSWGDLFK